MIGNTKKLKASIIIPCHNTDTNFFGVCIDSVINQTYGIENMQVIVVLHNCNKTCKKEIKNLLASYKEVEIYELENDRETPSSPRNFGVMKATGDYIGFLDADDYYTKNAIEDALKSNEKYDADVIAFRREYKLEKENAIPMKDCVLWNQLEKEILVEDKIKSTEEIFTGMCGLVTNKLFKNSFLKENDLTFDEEILFAEDYLYIIEVFNKANKILLLPQLIGYCYFINSKSLVQSGEKTPEILLNYAKGYVKIFEEGLKNGFYMNCIIQRLCITLSKLLVKNKTLSYEQRVEIKNLLEPYINLTTRMKESKWYSVKQCVDGYQFPREVILQPEKWVENVGNDILVQDDLQKKQNADISDTSDTSLKILSEIIADNLNTNIAKTYGFKDIMTVKGYMSKVPITDYEFYKPLIELTTRVGETQIFLDENVYAYIFTPGNTDETKLIPCTKKHLKPYIKAFDKIVRGHNTFLFMESSFIKTQYNDDAITNSLYGMILYSYLNDININILNDNTIFSSPRELMFPDRAVDITFERLYFAICDKNIDQIYAPYMWDIYISVEYLKKNWQMICDCVEKGELPNVTKISEKLRKRLSSIIRPMPERAEEIRNIFKKGVDENLLKNIWPKLERIVAVSIKTMRIYTNKILKYAKGVKIMDGLYASAEALIGEPTEEVGINKLCKESCFFEFRNVDDKNNIIQIGELKVGSKYEIIITNCAGLYRYRTYDVIEIVKLENEEIYFKYSYNVKDAANTITNTMVYDVIMDVLKNKNINIGDYSFVNHNENLLIILESENEKTEYEKLLHLDINLLEKEFDEKFEKYSDYKEAKIKKEITGVKIMLGEPETHLLYRDLQRKKPYYAVNQIRPVRLLDTDEKYNYFTNFVIK